MKYFYRWISEHCGLCKTLLFLLLAAFTIYAARFEYVSFLSIYLIDLGIWFLVGRFIAAAPAKLMREPIEIMDQQCDPQPLLKEMERQMARGERGPQRQLTELNYAGALRVAGQDRKCAEILEQINVDRYPGISPYSKFTYYNNLSDVLFALGRDQEALIWHRKAMQIYNDLPENKLKQQFIQTVQLSEADVFYHTGDPENALRKVAWIKCSSKRQLLDAALLAAKCHIVLEEPEKAREKLQYVIDNGNKLHIVEEAGQLLETLE